MSLPIGPNHEKCLGLPLSLKRVCAGNFGGPVVSGLRLGGVFIDFLKIPLCNVPLYRVRAG